MTSTHDDYDQHAREYAAGLLRAEAEQWKTLAAERKRLGERRMAELALTTSEWLGFSADWLEAPR